MLPGERNAKINHSECRWITAIRLNDAVMWLPDIYRAGPHHHTLKVSKTQDGCIT
ncbi:hypothetical protein M2418_003139 [Rhizobium sp. BIGb0125]|nr:hypothetical protein [Rhizobium sp. BIGb0125]